MIEILLVEETSLLSELYVRTLCNAGYAVTLASTGFEAGYLLRQKPWDLMLLDLHLPDMRGLELLRQIRDEADTPGVLILVPSTGMPSAVEAIHLGAEDFLVRPFPAERLGVSVRNLLKTRHLAARLRRFEPLAAPHADNEASLHA